MGTFNFDYTRSASRAVEKAKPPEKYVDPPRREAVRAEKKPAAPAVGRMASDRRPPVPPEPAFEVDGIPPSLAVRSKDGKSVIFKLRDSRSENGTGYASVLASAISRSPDGLSVRFGPGRAPFYGIVSGGKVVRSADGPDMVLARMRRDASIARRHEQAEHMLVPGQSGGKEIEDGAERDE